MTFSRFIFTNWQAGTLRHRYGIEYIIRGLMQYMIEHRGHFPTCRTQKYKLKRWKRPDESQNITTYLSVIETVAILEIPYCIQKTLARITYLTVPIGEYKDLSFVLVWDKKSHPSVNCFRRSRGSAELAPKQFTRGWDFLSDNNTNDGFFFLQTSL